MYFYFMSSYKRQNLIYSGYNICIYIAFSITGQVGAVVRLIEDTSQDEGVGVDAFLNCVWGE